jgi:hypothetical protein
MKPSDPGRNPQWWRRAIYMVAGLVLLNSTATSPSVATTSGTCATRSAGRELDYWLGDWTVTSPGGTAGATSTVSLDLDQCLLIESWNSGEGHRGKNLFAFNSDDGNWHGLFADNKGRVHVFEGRVASGSAEFSGASRGPNGGATLNRIKVLRVTPNKVEQIWEQSTDDGTTWATVFRGEYSRKRS